MPASYSDNLYTSLDSDTEEDQDALSPTDGYFQSQDSSSSNAAHTTPFVPNVLVDDPMMQQRTKEQEAEAAGVYAGSPTGGSPWQNRQGNEDGSSSTMEETAWDPSSRPLLQRIPSDAPPAYSPRSPTSPVAPQTGGEYQTFVPSSSSHETPTDYATDRQEESSRLLPRQPESMGDGGPPAPERPRLSRWEAFKEEWKDARWRTPRRKIRTVLGAVLILAILVSLLGSIFGLDGGGSNNKAPALPREPIHNPSQPGDLKWRPSKQCHPLPTPAHSYKSTANLAFTPQNVLSIYQKTEDAEPNIPSGRTPHISGNVILRPVDGESAGRMELEVLANHEDLTMKVDMNQRDQTLVLRTPRTVEWSEDGDPCIQIRVVVYVPFGSTLETLSVEVVHLDIDILPDLDLTVDNETLLLSVSGDVTAPLTSHILYNLESREIWVETVSGNIKGYYPLYDLLGLHTTSGTIETAVSPKAISVSKPKSARLDVASVSGDLTVKGMTRGNAPARDYVVTFDTASGTIDAEVAVSSKGKFHSQSADIKLKVWPFLEEGQKMTLETSTRSGTTAVEIQEPTWLAQNQRGRRSKLPLSSLKSKHSSVSGTIDLVYPSSWTGGFEAETISGTQKFRGDGLHTEMKSGMFPKVLKGWKGDGGSTLKVNSISGDEKFLVGRE